MGGILEHVLSTSWSETRCSIYSKEKNKEKYCHYPVDRSLYSISCSPLIGCMAALISKLQTVNVDTRHFCRHNYQPLLTKSAGRQNMTLLSKENISSIASILPGIGQFLMGGISSFAVNCLFWFCTLLLCWLRNNNGTIYLWASPFSDSNKKHVMNEINMIVRANAIGIPLLAIIQGAIATLGYYLFDAPSALLFGFYLLCYRHSYCGNNPCMVSLAAYMAISVIGLMPSACFFTVGLIVNQYR